MERKATSRDNPWMSGLWMVAILGMVIGGVALFIGHGMTWRGADPDPALGGIIAAAGSAVLIAALVALVAGVAVSAYLWEQRNS